VQNALPIWHTHSTVTGSATTLGIADQTKSAKLAAERKAGVSTGQGESEDAMLMQHYEGMDDVSEDGDEPIPAKVAVKVEVKPEPIDVDHEDEEDEEADTPPAGPGGPGADGMATAVASNGTAVMVKGTSIPPQISCPHGS
jgi:transcription initiation factor TFIIE subunit alpha